MHCPDCGKRASLDGGARSHWSNCPRLHEPFDPKPDPPVAPSEKFGWRDEDIELPPQGAKVTLPDGRRGTIFSAGPGYPHSGIAAWANVLPEGSTSAYDLESHDLSALR